MIKTDVIRMGLLLLAVFATGLFLDARAQAGEQWGPLLPVEWQAPTARNDAFAVAGGTAILALEAKDDYGARDLVLREVRNGKILWRTAAPSGVIWNILRTGREVAVVTQMGGYKPPAGGAYRIVDGVQLWTQTLFKNESLALGEDGTGIASWDYCSMYVRDVENGTWVKNFQGASRLVGEVREGKTSMHDLCVKLPRLLGEANGRAMVLPGAHPASLTAVDPKGQGWSLDMSQGATNEGADLATGLVWYIDDRSLYQAQDNVPRLVLQRLHLATGKSLWRREFPAAGMLSHLTRFVPGPSGKPALLIQTGTQAKLIAPEDGKELCSLEVGGGVAVAAGEERQPDGWAFGASGVDRNFVWISPTCKLVGQGEVSTGTKPLLHPAGFVLVRPLEWMALQLRDGRERYRKPITAQEVNLLGGLVVVPLGYPDGLLVVDAASGSVLGHTEVSGFPLAVVPPVGDKPRLLVFRAGYLFAVRVP